MIRIEAMGGPQEEREHHAVPPLALDLEIGAKESLASESRRPPGEGQLGRGEWRHVILTTRPPVNRTRSAGVRRKTVLGVPAAAQISEKFDRSSSTKASMVSA